MSYDYAVEDCDVIDKASLRHFRLKQAEWLNWLRHDENHAITKQIYGMLWSDAVFRLINLSRKHAQLGGGRYATQSGIVARALDTGYVAEQLIAFRRLLEPENRRPHNQVISLMRLIDEVKANRALFTRENFVCHDGLPFDDMGGADDLPPPNEHGISSGWFPIAGPRAVGMSSSQHEEFDGLMDHAPSGRQRSDAIGQKIFAEIEDQISAAPFRKLKLYANKILLHAADPTSIGATSVDSPTLADIWHCHNAILSAANRISVLIGGPHIGAVPTPQFDVLENWSSAFCPEEAFDEIRKAWEVQNEERESWTQALFK